MPEDLSHYHEPLANLFSWPLTPDDWNEYRLTNHQIDLFHEYGYLAGIRVLTDEQVEALRKELAEVIDPKHPGHHLFYEFHSNESTDPSTVLVSRVWARGESRPGFTTCSGIRRSLMPASQLLGGAVRFWHDQLFCKPAHTWRRRRLASGLFVLDAHAADGAPVLLDRAGRFARIENGCVHYVPGSHRWDLLPITGLASDMEAIRRCSHAEQWEQFKPGRHRTEGRRVLVPSSADGARLVRKPQRSSAPGAVINVFRDGVRSASDDSPLEGVPPVPTGEKMEGQFFPLLFVAFQTLPFRSGTCPAFR